MGDNAPAAEMIHAPGLVLLGVAVRTGIEATAIGCADAIPTRGDPSSWLAPLTGVPSEGLHSLRAMKSVPNFTYKAFRVGGTTPSPKKGRRCS